MKRWSLILMPLVLLGVLIVVIRSFGPGKSFRAQFPPVEELAFKRVVLKSGNEDHTKSPEIILHVVNDGPSDVTVSQVSVDEAYWQFQMTPGQTLSHLQSGVIRIPYPWVDGETHAIRVITPSGVTFDHEIAVAVESPSPGLEYLGIFSVLGLYVGVIPVFLGLLWFPAIRQAGMKMVHFLLSLTVGLLVFLAVDAMHEALEVVAELPGSYEGMALLFAGFAGSLLLLMTISLWSRRMALQRGEAFQRLALAYMVAVGIGLHNLGEGLAIGSAYALGNIALGSLLVIGFAIHNTTEGLAIIAPVSKERVSIASLIGMGMLAGVPTIFGAWIGGFTYSAVWSVLFLGIGAGAIVQVVYAILRQMMRQSSTEDGGLLTPLNMAGLASGFAIMYATGMLVAF
ncbi:MAG: metal transporter [Candidatus Poribacteria bacterium]|nr:metal transporter [Candidatus Poribacteria bacterium]